MPLGQAGTGLHCPGKHHTPDPPGFPTPDQFQRARLTGEEHMVFQLRRKYHFTVREVVAASGKAEETIVRRDRAAVRKLLAAGWKG